ncbi:MAG: hypothetical protein JW953_04480 [Anaerolineae bacterium]|nr:hypothetical protein [Anaerolineae bacterium]
MKNQITIATVGLIVLCMFGWYIDSLAHNEITEAVRWVVYALAFAIIAVLVGVSIVAVLIINERILKERADRKVMERDSKVMVVRAMEGEQVYIRDTDDKVTWRSAHLDGRIYANGRGTLPSQVEMAAWQTYMLRGRPNVISQGIEAQYLPAPTQVDLLAALDSVQRCLIVGPSDSGKTTLLQWLISRKVQTSKTIVIDPHGWPDKWPNSTVVGTGRNYAEIERGLDALVQLMTKRYDEIGKGMVVEGTHPRVTILIDEWRAIVYNVKGASEAIKALLTESRKAAFSVFVASHSDRAKPLGLEGEYDLKDGFAVVRLSNVNGQRQATLETGNGEVPAILPGPFTGTVPYSVNIDNLTFTEVDMEPEPTVAEACILRLYSEGKSISAIAEEVFGSKGGNQNQQVKEILQKYKGVKV